jgi:hypothetical protein
VTVVATWRQSGNGQPPPPHDYAAELRELRDEEEAITLLDGRDSPEYLRVNTLIDEALSEWRATTGGAW